MATSSVMTVLGRVGPEALGVVDAHSHLYIAPVPGGAADAPVLTDVEGVARELAIFRGMGGGAVVDCQPGGCGRDGRVLRRLSAETGVHVVASTGFHRRVYYPPNAPLFDLSATAAADYFLSEIRDGLVETRGEEPFPAEPVPLPLGRGLGGGPVPPPLGRGLGGGGLENDPWPSPQPSPDGRGSEEPSPQPSPWGRGGGLVPPPLGRGLGGGGGENDPWPSPQPSPDGRGSEEPSPQPSPWGRGSGPVPPPLGRGLGGGGLENDPWPSPQPSPDGRGSEEPSPQPSPWGRGGGPVYPGVIKIAAEATLDASPLALFEAAAEVCKATGYAIEMHTERGAAVEEFLAFFGGRGVSPRRLVFCHVDKRPDFGLHRELAQAGVLLEYDTFYRPKYEPERGVWPLLREMAAAGLAGQVALATDMADPALWAELGGGPGLAGIFTVIRPRLERLSLSEDAIAGLLGGNIAARLAVEK